MSSQTQLIFIPPSHFSIVIVQRGTNHLWRNTTDKVCRIAFILIEAPAYLHNGAPLAEDKPDHK